MLCKSIILANIISSIIIGSKVASFQVGEHEVSQVNSPSSQPNVTGVVHLSTRQEEFKLNLPPVSSALTAETASSMSPLSVSKVPRPHASARQVDTRPLLTSWVPTVLPVDSGASTESLRIPHIQLESSNKTMNAVLFNHEEVGTPQHTGQLHMTPFSNGNQVDILLSKGNSQGPIPSNSPVLTSKTLYGESSDFSVQNPPSTALQPTGSTTTSSFSPIDVAMVKTIHNSPQDPSHAGSVGPIYTYPRPQQRVVTTQNPELLTKTKATSKPAFDILNTDRSVLFSVSELQPGILRPTSTSITHQAITLIVDQSSIRSSTYPITSKTATQFGEGELFNNTTTSKTAQERTASTSRSDGMGSPNKGTWDSLSVTTIHSTPNYQIHQTKNKEKTTDLILGDENSSDIGPTPVSNGNKDGNCSSDKVWNTIHPDTEGGGQNASFNPHFLSVPPLFVLLHTDWNTALAEWGLAWDLHVYGLGSLFCLVTVISAIGILCLPFRSPPGLGYFMVINGLLFLTSSIRTFIFLYDAYCYQHKLPAMVALLLYDLVFPCLTSAFGVVVLILSLRSGPQAGTSRFQRSCFLTTIIFLHFTLTIGTILVITLLKQAPFLLFVSHGIFVVLVTILSILYFTFYCHARMVGMQVYSMKTSTPCLETLNAGPLRETEHWGRVAKLAMWTAVFSLSCAALQLYAILYRLGLAGDHVFQPWPWWIFHFGTSLCEVGMCLTMSLIGIYPLFCTSKTSDRNHWNKMFCLSPTHVSMKAPILSNTNQWSTPHQVKTLNCDVIIQNESECVPLYTMPDNQLSSGEESNLIYHSSETSEIRNLDFHLKHGGSSRTSSFISVQIDSDSTVDLRPPSPINLRRSIDEALFSEALIPESLFHWSKLHSSSNMSLCGNRSMPASTNEVFKENSADRGLYRTSSCVGVERTEIARGITNTFKKLNMTQALSSERWEDSSVNSICRTSQDGSSLVLCSRPEKSGFSTTDPEQKSFRDSSPTSLHGIPQLTKQFQALSSPETMDKNDPPDSATQVEFIKICRQIDQLSISSDTIEL
ncbi:proline-rich transmembrane protein 4-like [Stegostoma tigrinum]|uniref:proline-rich transmembrane protein 4-like n=1 Tax=Stegostoma tigrinum TaxID=3053191 RepID=UPI00202B9A30|nr:proline-rich transmembrane protein 4-like [Stegostoma tigrinum]